MKAIAIHDAQGQLSQLLAAACRGELIVLTDGNNQVTLSPGPPLDLELDSPELEAELLRSVNSRSEPLRESELVEIADRAKREYRANPRG